MNVETFRTISKQIDELEATGLQFDVNITGDNHWVKDCAKARFEPIHIKMTSLAHLAIVQKLTGGPINFGYMMKAEIKDLKTLSCIEPVDTVFKRDFASKKHASLKFYHKLDTMYNLVDGIQMMMIVNTPPEQVEDGVTYRYIGTDHLCIFCVPDTDNRYNYLDQGHFYLTIPKNYSVSNRELTIITDAMTVDTYLSLLLIRLLEADTACVEMLQNDCFLSSQTAKATRVRLEKRLTEKVADVKWSVARLVNVGYNFPKNVNGTVDRMSVYQAHRTIVLTEYEKVMNNGLLTKLLDGSLPTGSYNSIKLTKNSATYETVSIEAEGFLKTVTDSFALDERTDIYVLIRNFLGLTISQLEGHGYQAFIDKLAKQQAEAAAPVTTNDTDEEETEQEEAQEEEAAADTSFSFSFTINKIPITISRVAGNTRRYVNDVPINKSELELVCYRASCFNDAAEYARFVNSVKDMSLRNHDFMANGIGLKIQKSLTEKELSAPDAPTASPKLRFKKVNGKVQLLLDEKDTSVDVNFNMLIRLICQLNKRTNGCRNHFSGLGYKDTAWARSQVSKILKTACTFKTKTLVTDSDGKPILDANNKKQYILGTTCTITDEQAKIAERMARDYYEKALERSKLYLEKIVKQTNAKLEKFTKAASDPGDYWIVKGKLRTYAVHATNNKVYNYDTGAYVCIVDTGHNVAVGYDYTAARLLALANDSMMASQINTL